MNKNSIFLVIAIFFILNGIICAQTKKGDIQIGTHSIIQISGSNNNVPMSIGWSKFRVKSDNENIEYSHSQQFSINISPRVGYFITNKIVVGLDLSFTYSNFEVDETEFGEKNIMINSGPFIRYYVYQSKIIPFVELNYSVGKKNDIFKSPDYVGNFKYKTQQIGLGLGMGIPISDNAFFDVLVAYYHFNLKRTEGNDDNRRSIIEAIGLKLGFTLNI